MLSILFLVGDVLINYDNRISRKTCMNVGHTFTTCKHNHFSWFNLVTVVYYVAPGFTWRHNSYFSIRRGVSLTQSGQRGLYCPINYCTLRERGSLCPRPQRHPCLPQEPKAFCTTVGFKNLRFLLKMLLFGIDLM